MRSVFSFLRVITILVKIVPLPLPLEARFLIDEQKDDGASRGGKRRVPGARYREEGSQFFNIPRTRLGA